MNALGRALVLAFAVAPLAGCHLIFGYSAGESPAGEQRDLTRAVDRPRIGPEGPGPDIVPPDIAFNPCPAAPCGATCCEGQCLSGTCSVTLQATADTYVLWSQKDANFGAAVDLRVANYTIEIADTYLRFPTELFVGRKIDDATLRLIVTEGTGLPVKVDIGVVDVKWDEMLVTFANSKCDAAQGCAGTATQVTLDKGVNLRKITARVQDLADNPAATGFFVWRPVPELSWNEAKIASKDYVNPLFRPVLEVKYH